jgi:ribosomal protein L37AE/L43A
MENERYKKIRCPYCNSRFNYFKIKEKIWQCRGCGEKFKFDRKKLGHPHTEETKKVIADKHKNELNVNWKGDDVGRTQLHEWVRRRKEKPDFCEICGINKPHDLANISGEYKRDVDDFKWLCRLCHMKDDGRINNLKQFQGENNINKFMKKVKISSLQDRKDGMERKISRKIKELDE